MFRFRRYRTLLVCAFVIIVLLYHVSQNSQWDHSREVWHGDPKIRGGPRPPPPKQESSGTKGSKDYGYEEPQKPNTPEEYKTPSKTTEMPGVPDRKVPGNHDGLTKPKGGTGDAAGDAYGENQPSAPTSTAIHWKKPKEWFPVPEQELIMLPTGTPKRIPTIQFAFSKESPAEKEKREQRLAKVKEETQRAWSGYKKYAWTHDELRPVSKKSKDPFCGWAATLVDSLDTLWIMGLKEEFEEAVEAVKDIDFTTTPYRDDIPVFETIIRYLGGLIGAYDVTGNDPKYKSLLNKAVELAEILMSVFDTPNRMPILYYHWKPDFNVDPKRASTNAGVAELGSMSMEFTRLAQLTGKHKYYDAIARITDAFEDLQNREGATAIPGIFPENLDASGCNRTATQLQQEAQRKKQEANAGLGAGHGYTGSSHEYGAAEDVQSNVGSSYGSRSESGSEAVSGSGTDTESSRGLRKRLPPRYPSRADLTNNFECVPQNLTGSSGYGGGAGSYSMGGSQDSAYEYFPKQYLLLGGLVPKYRTMHEKTVKAVKEYLLFRPMAEGDPDILFSAKAYSSDGTDKKLSYQYEVTHLTCFLGGMFGLGGKIFESPEDVEIGKKLAEGCVWAYDVMPTGIMPEYAQVLPCQDPKNCHYDEKVWYKALDPQADRREEELGEYYEKLEKWKAEVERLKKEHALQKQTAEEKRDATTDSAGTSSTKEPRDSLESSDDADQKTLNLPPEPIKPQSHLEYVNYRIKNEHIPSGFTDLRDKRYILR
jgi:mannosyl-oligosaccharide alpha-1,2-mannosidase